MAQGLPSVNGYGIVENPLVFTPFAYGTGGDVPVPNNAFLLLDGSLFKLLDGSDLLELA